MHADVNLDFSVTSADALAVINEIARNGEQPAQFSNFDVNGDGRITVADALAVVNEIARPRTHVVTFALGPINTHGLEPGEVLWAINSALAEYEAIGDVDFRLTSGRGDFHIRSAELHLGNGVHARGLASLGGNVIQFHNGHISAANSRERVEFDFIMFKTPQGLKQVIQHEIGHALMRFGHSGDTSCVMNINAATDQWCPAEIAGITRRYGVRQD